MSDKKKYKRNYQDQDVINAVTAIRNGQSIRIAAAMNNVPVTTVR